MNREVIYLNPHLIEKIEEKPDTIVTMESQTQYIVIEKTDEIIKKIIDYRRSLGSFDRK